jgi:putative transposase
MSGNYTELYVHLVWATWDRLPLITVEFQEQLYACVVAKCEELNCQVIALGGVEDHVHLLVRLAASESVSKVVKEVKGASSHLMTHVLQPDIFFKWQGSYGAFTVSSEAVPGVRQYILSQKEHHEANDLVADWERCEQVWVR